MPKRDDGFIIDDSAQGPYATNTKDYIFYERADDKGVSIAARLTGGKFTGRRAQEIERYLLANGYPQKTPDRILYGTRLWAVPVPEQTK